MPARYRLVFELNRINLFFTLISIKDEVKNVLFLFVGNCYYLQGCHTGQRER